MAIDRSKLSAIIAGRARALCSPEGDRLMDNYKTKGTNGNTTINENIATNVNPLTLLNETDNYWGVGSYNDNHSSYTGDINYDEQSIALSKLPENIKESFSKQKINMTGNDGLSVLDSMDISLPKKQITEVKQNVNIPQSQYVPMGNNIDYSIIKAIVNECLNEYFSKNMLNENTSLQTIALKDGNISLVDNKGNIFKAKLEKIGNKNDKK